MGIFAVLKNLVTFGEPIKSADGGFYYLIKASEIDELEVDYRQIAEFGGKAIVETWEKINAEMFIENNTIGAYINHKDILKQFTDSFKLPIVTAKRAKINKEMAQERKRFSEPYYG